MFELVSHQIFLIPVAICGLIAAGIGMERFFYLFVRASTSATSFFTEVQRRIVAGDLGAAMQYARSEPHAAVPRALKEVLLDPNREYQKSVETLDIVLLELQTALHTRVAYMATLANIVTLIGLLGTIVGLIQSFSAVSSANPAEKQELLARGISTAMYATAGGISIAIPCLIVHSLLEQKAQRLVDDAEAFGLRLAMLLDARRRGAKSETSVSADAT